MTFKQKLELFGGLLTGILGCIIPLSFHTNPNLSTDYKQNALIFKQLFFYFPGILFALVCFFHVATKNVRLRYFLIILGGWYLLTLPYLFIVGGYSGGFRTGFLVIIPAITAIITLLATRTDKLQ